MSRKGGRKASREGEKEADKIQLTRQDFTVQAKREGRKQISKHGGRGTGREESS